jgi:hypothetical protein
LDKSIGISSNDDGYSFILISSLTVLRHGLEGDDITMAFAVTGFIRVVNEKKMKIVKTL